MQSTEFGIFVTIITVTFYLWILKESLISETLKQNSKFEILMLNCEPPQDFNAKGESTRMTGFHFKTKEFILTHFSTLAILPH